MHGEELTPTIVFHQPTLRWTAEEGKFYTVIFSDPDAPSAADPKFGEWVRQGPFFRHIPHLLLHSNSRYFSPSRFPGSNTGSE